MEKRGNVFKRVYTDFITGDIYTKTSLLVWSVGYFARRQYLKGILVTLFQALVIALYPAFLWDYAIKFNTLGTVQYEATFDLVTKQKVPNDYDHSFKILLFGVVSIVLFIAAIFMTIANLRAVRAAEERVKTGHEKYPEYLPMPTVAQLGNISPAKILFLKVVIALRNTGRHIKGVVQEYTNEKFHITLLSLPTLGILVFTVVPLIVIILVGFTNYDQQHLPPNKLFSWVGITNFKTLFSNVSSLTFGYSFRKILTWTLVWAFLATFTNYYAGILLALFINNKKTKVKRLWRTCFVVTIAVPQFVSLLLVRNFFANSGIVNTICSNLGITDLLKQIGLLRANATFIPFLTNAQWARVMIIIINMWVGVPYLMLMSTGILMNIPQDLLESAQIDGANSFQRFRHITMPYIRFVTGAYLVSSIVTNINNFNIIYLLTNDIYVAQDQLMPMSNAREVDLLVTWLYRLTQEINNYKMASVIGIVIFAICATFTLLAFMFLNRGDREERFQ